MILSKQKNIGLKFWNDNVPTEKMQVSNCEMISSKQKNAGLKLWNDIVQTEKCRAILPLNPDLSGMICTDKYAPILVMILQHFSVLVWDEK